MTGPPFQLDYESPRQRPPPVFTASRFARWSVGLVIAFTLIGLALGSDKGSPGVLAVFPVFIGGAAFIIARIISHKPATAAARAVLSLMALCAYLAGVMLTVRCFDNPTRFRRAFIRGDDVIRPVFYLALTATTCVGLWDLARLYNGIRRRRRAGAPRTPPDTVDQLQPLDSKRTP